MTDSIVRGELATTAVLSEFQTLISNHLTSTGRYLCVTNVNAGHITEILAHVFHVQFKQCEICLTWSPYSVSVFMLKWTKYLLIPLIGEYLNSVKSEKQKPNVECQAASDSKEVRYQNNKSTYLFFNWNMILLSITMTIKINNSLINNKIIFVHALRSVNCVSHVGYYHQHAHAACSSEPSHEYVDKLEKKFCKSSYRWLFIIIIKTENVGQMVNKWWAEKVLVLNTSLCVVVWVMAFG